MNIIRTLLIINAFALAGIGVALGVHFNFVIGVLIGILRSDIIGI